jgi:hypothetical protein
MSTFSLIVQISMHIQISNFFTPSFSHFIFYFMFYLFIHIFFLFSLKFSLFFLAYFFHFSLFIHILCLTIITLHLMFTYFTCYRNFLSSNNGNITLLTYFKFYDTFFSNKKKIYDIQISLTFFIFILSLHHSLSSL